jgi:hypothetical protein
MPNFIEIWHVHLEMTHMDGHNLLIIFQNYDLLNDFTDASKPYEKTGCQFYYTQL